MGRFDFIFLLIISFCGLRVQSFTRPSIQVYRGNLNFHGAKDKDISFQVFGKGNLVLNGVSISALLKLVENSSNKYNQIDQCRADATSALTKLLEVDRFISKNSDVSKRLEVLEKNGGNSTTTRSIQTLRRIILRLLRRMRTLTGLLTVNECASNPCMNGGTCQDMYNSFICHCPNNWEGLRCNTDVNECSWYAGTDLGCQNGATCINKPGSYECLCGEGWFGLHCNRRSQDCSSSSDTCGHGTCVSQKTGIGFKCICDQGWKTDGVRPACTVDVNECEAYHPPCSVNPKVECVNLPGSFHCGNCPIGYVGNGFYCTDVDECAIFNGGCSVNPMVQCINIPGSKTCGPCPTGYLGNGVSCTYQGGACAVGNGGCNYLAQCRDNSRISLTYVECICPTGYTGNGIGERGCVKGTDACSPNPCMHGTCSTTPTGYVCNCNMKFTGTNCDIAKTSCASNPCLNGGTCHEVYPLSYYCSCTPLYKGTNCEEQRQSCGDRLSGTSGHLSNQNRNSTETRLDNCAWVIETTTNRVLRINYTLTGFTTCTSSFLQINDGPNVAANLIGRFCGSPEIKGQIVSTSHRIYLWYRSKNQSLKPHFELSWKDEEPVCGGNVAVSSHGSFKSPGAPGNYPPNRDCFWIFTAPLGKRIQFHFFSLMIGNNKNCNNDYLEFLDGQEIDDSLLSKYCNTSHPEPLTTPGNVALAHFHSNSIGSFPGFQITYSIVDGTPGCGKIYSTSNGIISSPVSNGEYPPNSYCEYKINVGTKSKIKITFLSLSIEEAPNCLFDYVAIYDGGSTDSPLLGKLCGNKIPAPIIPLGTEVLIVFKSDWNLHGEGFRLKYERICGGKYIDSVGSFTSPNYPAIQNGNEIIECIYQIIQPDGVTIFLNVTDLDFGNSTSENCENAYLEIRNGDNENSTLIGKYCEKAPNPIVSNFNYLWIKYYSNYASVKGFQIKYNSVKSTACGGILKASFGSIESPANLDEYTKGLQCTWFLIAPQDYIVQINWLRFHLEDSVNCTYDKIQIFDNGTVPGNQIGQFCGRNLPPTITSLSNKMSVIFSVDSSYNMDGFFLTYSFIHERNVCGGTFFTTTGVIKSPRFPEEYPLNKDCTWIITVPTGQQIMLNVSVFNIERFYSCKFDYLEIRNGGTSASPLIGKYCGTTIPQRIPSHANQLYLRFRSDSTKSGEGFKIFWDSAATGCGGTLSSPSGSIISPHYPEPYGRDSRCLWKISISEGSVIQITFADLDLEPNRRCSLDYVQIFDGNSITAKSLGKFCTQESSPPLIRSTTNQMVIVFRSDPTFQGRGFQIQYSTICKNVISGFNGVIESPNFPNRYPRKLDCLWEIGVPEGNKINITFSHFDIRAIQLYLMKNCSMDYLEVRYKDPEEEEQMLTYGRYCNEAPPDMTLDSNKTEIRFVTDESFFGRTGFRLEWSIFGCGGILTHPTGTIQTPNYPMGYPSNTRCDWLIQTEFGSSVEINFHDIDLERTSECSYDYIQIFNGLDDTFPQLTTICHVGKEPMIVTSVGSNMFIRFQSDFTYKGRGFIANYTTVPIQCGGKLTSHTGSFHSPNYPNNYEVNTRCAWLITVQENHRLRLDFPDVDLLDCHRSYVKVYDGPTEAYPVLTTLCLKMKPNNTIVSSTNHVYVEMMSNATYSTSKGFIANYSMACGAKIRTQSSGIIDYADEIKISTGIEDCSWTIISERPDEHVFLTISYLEGKYCSDDAGLFIYDGEDNNSTLIGRYCSTKIPPLIKSTGSALHLDVKGDYYQYSFTAKYSVVDSTCGGELEALSGTFTSPDYPKNYPVDTECEWIIKVGPGNRGQITFSKFDLNDSPNCNEDYLEAREVNSTGKLLGVFCGSTLPTNITANNNIWLFFKSVKPVAGSTTVTAAGFMAEFELSHGMELTGTSGQIATPLYPRFFRNNEVFSWKITVRPGHHITIKFLDFYTDNYYMDDECSLSYFTAYDGSDETSPKLGEFCGMQLPPLIESTSNVIYLKMVHDMMKMGSKFLLEWEQVKDISRGGLWPTRRYSSCGTDKNIAIAEGEKYNLTSPNYPKPYEKALVCTWFLESARDMHLIIRFEVINLRVIYPYILGDKINIYSSPAKSRFYHLVETVFLPANITKVIATSNKMKVSFLSSYFYRTQNITGFFAVVSSVCGGNIDSTPNGIIKVDNNTEFENNTSPYTCEWKISVRTGKTIKVEFSKFNLGEDVKECKNYLLMKNGQYSDSPTLGSGKYCGTQLPANLETSGNNLYIKYNSYSSTTEFKLKFSETSIACGGSIRLDQDINSTQISSPNYPNIPNPHTECVWSISAPSGEALRVDFIDRFDLATTKECTTEFVELRDGGTKSSKLIGRYCNDTPSTQKTLQNMLYVKYFTDLVNPSNGFKAEISIATCGGVIRWKNGVIKSPGFGEKNKYPTKANCKWTIIGKRDHYLILDFELIDLQNGINGNCNASDNVIITEPDKMNGTERTIGTYCGKDAVRNIISSTNEVNIYFQTNDRKKPLKGFKLLFNSSQEECGGTIEADAGVIKSPGYPLMNHYNRNCEWTIRVPKGRRVKVEIDDIDFDKSVDFFSQGLAFYSEDFSSVINYLKANDNSTRVIRSSDNIMKIFFWSSHASTHRGFTAHFSSNEPTICVGDFNLDSGVISTPNSTTFKCTWKRNVNMAPEKRNSTIVMHFDIYVEDQSSTCSRGLTYLNVNYDKDKLSIAELCKTTSKPEIVVAPNRDIIYTALHARAKKYMNFTMTYKTHACGGVITKPIGSIKSPNYPKTPTESVDCAWVISAPEEQSIVINIASLDLDQDCEKNYLNIYNGDSPKSPKIGKFCRNDKSNFQSQHNSLWIEYHYEINSGGTGFNITYEPLTKGCGGILQSTSAIIETPMYPKNYPEDIECLWELRAKEGYQISVDFIDRFQIEESDKCVNDFVAAYNEFDDEKNSTLKKYCGRERPAIFNSTSNKMFVLFRSNHVTSGVGFRATWSLECGGTFYAEKNVKYIVSPAYPENYSNRLHCTYKILAPAGKLIYIIFEDFDLEGGDGCSYDNLSIANNRKNVRLLHHFSFSRYEALSFSKYRQYCGTNLPPKMIFSNTVDVVFKTDNWITRRGFKFSYQTDLCGGMIDKPTIIEGESDTDSYASFDGKEVCTWNITAPKNQRVSIMFLNVSLPQSYMCIFQYLKIYESDKIITSLCGDIDTTNLPVVHSNKNKLSVVLVVPSMYRRRRTYFKAAVYFGYGPQVGCGGDFTIQGGQSKVIETPKLDGNMDCIWTFQTSSNQSFKIEIITESYEPCYNGTKIPGVDNCTCIKYEFRDGLTSMSELIATECDRAISAQSYKYYTSRNKAWLRIASSVKISTPTKIRFTASDYTCGKTVFIATKEPQYLQSPNFPLPYLPGTKCIWKIKTYTSDKIEVKLIQFDLNVNSSVGNQTAQTCDNKNKLEIIDNEHQPSQVDYDLVVEKRPSAMVLTTFSRMLGTHVFCSKDDTGYEYYSASREIQLNFYSNNLPKRIGEYGFKLQYNTLGCNRNYTNLQGRIYKSMTTDNCLMYIIVPQNRTISLYFLNFFVTIGNSCEKTNFEVFDGNSTSEKLIEACRSFDQNPVFSTGNQLLIKYKSVFPIGNTFDIIYTSTTEGRGCGGQFYNYKGALSSPMYPHTYKENSVCTFEIKVPLGLQVALKFSFFDLQGSCESNYVKVITYGDGSSSNQINYCKGETTPAVVISPSSRLTVVFKSSPSNEGTGWFAKFMAITSDIKQSQLNW